MRPIDADELLKKLLDMANYPSSFVRAEPTLKVVPISLIEEIKTKLADYSFWQTAGNEPLVTISDVNMLIDQAIKECDRHENKI